MSGEKVVVVVVGLWAARSEGDLGSELGRGGLPAGKLVRKLVFLLSYTQKKIKVFKWVELKWLNSLKTYPPGQLSQKNLDLNPTTP